MSFETIIAAVETAIKNRTASVIRGTFARGIKLYSTSDAACRAYTWEAEQFRALAAPCLDYFSGMDEVRLGYRRANELNPAKVEAFAAKAARDAVAGIAAKVAAKVGNLDDMRFNHLIGASFEVTGTRNGRRIHLVQDIIVNCSSKGTVFNQYPAKVYLDGKKISAAAYARTFAA